MRLTRNVHAPTLNVHHVNALLSEGELETKPGTLTFLNVSRIVGTQRRSSNDIQVTFTDSCEADDLANECKNNNNNINNNKSIIIIIFMKPIRVFQTDVNKSASQAITMQQLQLIGKE